MQLQAIRTMSALLVLSGSMMSASLAQTGETNLTALPKQFAATAIGQAGPAAGKSIDLTIYITGWTTEEQRSANIATLKAKGQDGLVSAMDKTEDVGRLSSTGSVGIGVRFAHYRPTANGGLHIVIATNRPISFLEVYNMSRTQDYPFSILEFDVDKSGKGSGTFTPLCKVRFNKKNELEIENFGQKPFRLENVYLQK